MSNRAQLTTARPDPTVNDQNSASDQAGTGPAGGTPEAGTVSAAGGDGGGRPRRGDTLGTSAGHTTAGGGTGADVTDILTDGDGSADGDADMRTDGAEIVGGRGDAAVP